METVSYPSCSFESRDSALQTVTGLVCGGDSYGDCTYAAYSGDSFVALYCPGYAIGVLSGSSSSGSVIDTVTLSRVPQVSPSGYSHSGALVIANTPYWPVSVDPDNLEELLVVFLSLYLVLHFFLRVLSFFWYKFFR